MPLATSAFNLPEHLSPKAAPSLIAHDEQHFAAIAASLEETIADLKGQLEAIRKSPSRFGQEAVEKDVETRRLTGRLKALKTFGVECVKAYGESVQTGLEKGLSLFSEQDAIGSQGQVGQTWIGR